MKNIIAVIALSFVLSGSVFAQKENNIWHFGAYAGLDFNSGTPIAITGNLTTTEGCAGVSDNNGNLLFYTDGVTIWNKSGKTMPHGDGTLLGSYTSTQSALIVPVPDSSNIFYVFTVDAQAGQPLASSTGYGGAAYNIVDMRLDSGNGDIRLLNQKLIKPTTEKLTATHHANGKDFWVLIHQWDSDAFYAYLLSNNGLSSPVISHSGIIHTDVGSKDSAEAIGYMKFSPDGNKLALACQADLKTVQIFDFDKSTGMVSNPITDTAFGLGSAGIGPYGVSFSPDNSKLYISLLDYKIYQYNMLAGSGASIISSKTVVASPPDQVGALQLGPDGKLYVSLFGSDFLIVIDDPDSAGTACHYTNGPALRNNTTCKLGLPNCIDDDMNTGPSTGVNKVEAVSSLLITPNPAETVLHISAANIPSTADISIFNMDGKECLAFNKFNMDINVSTLPKGIYVIKVKTPEGVSVKKFVKQ